MIDQAVIPVQTAGANGAGSGSAATVPALNGLLHAVYLSFHSALTAPNTVVKLAMENTPNENFYSAVVSTTGWFYPRKAVVASNGVAIGSGMVDRYVVNGRVVATVTLSDAHNPACITSLYLEK